MDSPCIKQTVCKVLKIFQCGKYLVAYVLNIKVELIFVVHGRTNVQISKQKYISLYFTKYHRQIKDILANYTLKWLKLFSLYWNHSIYIIPGQSCIRRALLFGAFVVLSLCNAFKVLFCSSGLHNYSPFICSAQKQKAPQATLSMQGFYIIIEMYEHSCK